MNDLLAPTQDLSSEPIVDESKNYLEDLVGEDKKFKSVEDLAKGKAQSDSYIKTLEERLDEMREDYMKLREEHMAGPKLQELLDKLDAQGNLQEQPPKTQEDKVTAFDPKAVESLISDSILKHEQTKKQQENYTSVKNKLIEKLGPKYQDALKARSDKLGLSQTEVNNMAMNNPALFSKTFDLDTATNVDNFQTPPRSERRSDNFSPRTPEKRNWHYYQNMRKTNPVAWMDRKVAIQMEKDAQEQGDSFYRN